MDLSERDDPSVRHPWEQARARFFRRLSASEGLNRSERWLDVGAGDAWLAGQLVTDMPANAVMVCWDPNYSADDLIELRRDSDPRMLLTTTRPEGQFDAISLLDVLEHVEDPANLLGSVRALLTPGGRVVVSVPAYQALYSAHDLAMRHHRRYHPTDCRSLLTAAGLRVVREGGLFASLIPPRAAARAVERVRGVRVVPGAFDRYGDSGSHGVGRWRRGPLITRTITGALAADAALAEWASQRSIRLPGLSYWAVCRAK